MIENWKNQLKIFWQQRMEALAKQQQANARKDNGSITFEYCKDLKSNFIKINFINFVLLILTTKFSKKAQRTQRIVELKSYKWHL